MNRTEEWQVFIFESPVAVDELKIDLTFKLNAQRALLMGVSMTVGDNQ